MTAGEPVETRRGSGERGKVAAGGLGCAVKAERPELAGGLDGGGGVESKWGDPGFRCGSHFRPEVPSFLIYPLVFLAKSQLKELSRTGGGP